MATYKQSMMIRAKQHKVGGKLSTLKQLAPMSNAKVQEWVKLLDAGINPQMGNPSKSKA